MNQKQKLPRPFTIHGCEIFSIRESKMGGKFVSVMGMLLPLSDVKKLSKKLQDAIKYLEEK